VDSTVERPLLATSPEGHLWPVTATRPTNPNGRFHEIAAIGSAKLNDSNESHWDRRNQVRVVSESMFPCAYRYLAAEAPYPRQARG
jgi:hypothetical protein